MNCSQPYSSKVTKQIFKTNSTSVICNEGIWGKIGKSKDIIINRRVPQTHRCESSEAFSSEWGFFPDTTQISILIIPRVDINVNSFLFHNQSVLIIIFRVKADLVQHFWDKPHNYTNSSLDEA